MTTQACAVDTVRNALHDDPFWHAQLDQLRTNDTPGVALHLAILRNPYLQHILDGRKTIESRFSVQRRVPYQQIQRNDIVLLKRSGGPILGIALVQEAMFYQLTPMVLNDIRTRYGHALCIDDPDFWVDRANAAFGTLVRLCQVRTLPPIPFVKRDQRAWIVLQQRIPQLVLFPQANHLAAD
jgi:hypothetical protein